VTRTPFCNKTAGMESGGSGGLTDLSVCDYEGMKEPHRSSG